MKPNNPPRPTAAPNMERQNDLQRIGALAQSGKWAEAIAATERWLKPGSRDAEFMRVRAVLEGIAAMPEPIAEHARNTTEAIEELLRQSAA